MTVSSGDTAEVDIKPRKRAATWLNWVLAVLTAPAAAGVVVLAIGAVLSVAACSTAQCPDLGPSGILFNVMLYGAPVVSGVTILASFFTAAKRWGIAVPLAAWALLLIDLAGLLIVFRS